MLFPLLRDRSAAVICSTEAIIDGIITNPTKLLVSFIRWVGASIPSSTKIDAKTIAVSEQANIRTSTYIGYRGLSGRAAWAAARNFFND